LRSEKPTLDLPARRLQQAMGRGFIGAGALQGTLRTREGERFPLPQLDRAHPASDLWNVVGHLAAPGEERRYLRERLALDPLRVDGRPQQGLRHFEMRPYRDTANKLVWAAPMSRQFVVFGEDEELYGTVGDYLLQDEQGQAGICRRRDFPRHFARSGSDEAAAPLAAEQVRVAAAREALLVGDLERAFEEIESRREALEANVQLREISESLQEAAWERAPEGPADLALAERISDWIAGAEAAGH
jgi:hypothetical protein